MNKINEQTTYSYDDLLIEPGYSEILPTDTILKTRFSRNIKLEIPLVSAAMDTVTEHRVAITMAQNGGIGVIHKNMSAEQQAKEVSRVKYHESGLIKNPFTISPEQKLSDLLELNSRRKITGVPVVNNENQLVGIITNRDIRFEKNPDCLVGSIMTPREKLITALEGISLEDAKQILHKYRIEKLPITNREGQLKGLITIKDILNTIEYPLATKDQDGRLRVAAAIGIGEKEFERAKLLIHKNVDAIVIDTAHGHTKGVIDMIRLLKSFNPTVDIIAGNVATPAACQALIDVGVDAIKIGIGPGSICTTRIIAGIGVPQFSAVRNCHEVCNKADIPFIADGGIKYSGDMVKALAAGASTVMIGSLFAGTDEAPGEMVLYQGRTYKQYRGMGSLGAMALGSKDRYGQGAIEDNKKLVPEGIEGQVPYRGTLLANIYQLIGGLRSGMGYVGAKTLDELRKKASFIVISGASLKESHPHNIMITKESPNYRSDLK